MKRLVVVLALLIFCCALAKGQSACAQLGVDCSHPNIEQRPSAPLCDAACRQQAQRAQDEYWQRREEYDRERELDKQRRKEQKAAEKANKEANKRIAEANRFSAQAWAFMQKEDCGRAVELYDQALKLTKFLQWSKNRTVCLGSLHRYDEAYANWETLINDPATPDGDVRAMRMEEWNIMYNRGYICPAPPSFNGTEDCYRRPDHQTLDTTYVPLPYIEGKTWTAKDVISSGRFTVTTRDGHEWHSGEVNMTTLNLLDARIKTDKGTVVRFLLPDDTTFVIGPNSDMKMDDFVYNPNESRTDMMIQMTKGFFRFVTGKLSHRDPTSKNVKLPVGSLGIRGCDVEIEHDPDGKGTWNEGTDRWWVLTYDGDINFVDDDSHQTYAIPVGQHLLKVKHAAGYPITYTNNHSLTDLAPNYDDSPGAAATAIQQKSQLSVTDFWDNEIAPHITGRQ